MLVTAMYVSLAPAGGGAGDVGAVTVIVAVPLCPSLVAVMVAVPAPIAVTTPDVVTVATAPLLVDHVMARPVSVLPLASSVAAESVTVPPTDSDLLPGVTTTDATGVGAGGVTVICALPTF